VSDGRWVDGGRAAVLLIDMINPLDFAGAHEMRNAVLAVAASTRRLARAARRMGVCCIYVNDRFGATGGGFADLLLGAAASNHVARRVVDLLAPTADDVTLLKPQDSAFAGTELDRVLADRAVERLILTGIARDNAVFATAQDAYIRRFDLWIPPDCVASAATDQPAALRNLARTMKARVRKFGGRLS